MNLVYFFSSLFDKRTCSIAGIPTCRADYKHDNYHRYYRLTSPSTEQIAMNVTNASPGSIKAVFWEATILAMWRKYEWRGLNAETYFSDWVYGFQFVECTVRFGRGAVYSRTSIIQPPLGSGPWIGVRIREMFRIRKMSTCAHYMYLIAKVIENHDLSCPSRTSTRIHIHHTGNTNITSMMF